MLTELVYTFIGIGMLYAGAELLVRGSVAASNRFQMPLFITGLIVIGLGTSSPELVVTIEASLTDQGEIAVGNIIGSNISNIALILGIAALLRPLPVKRGLFRLEIPVLLVTSLIMIYFLWDGFLSRVEGIILLTLLLLYFSKLLYHQRSRPVDSLTSDIPRTPQKIPAMLFFIVAGLALLVIGADFMIRGAVGLGNLFNLSEAVIGLSIVAIGTSLPELATAIVASVRRENELMLGGIMGSNILNILFILGITAIIKPMALQEIQLIDLVVMIFLTVLLWPFFYTGERLCRKEGAFLLACYAIYLVILFAR